MFYKGFAIKHLVFFYALYYNLEILKRRIPLTEGELERLNEEFLIEYTYNSNAIEGNTLTLRETDMVLRGLTIDGKSLKEHLEIIGHKEAFDYVRQLVSENARISEKVIKDIHYLVLADKKEDRGISNLKVYILLSMETEEPEDYWLTWN